MTFDVRRLIIIALAVLLALPASTLPVRAQGPLEPVRQFFRDLGEARDEEATTRRDRRVHRTVTRQPKAVHRRKVVRYPSKYASGTIVIDTRKKHLYYILDRKRALRYWVGVGRQGFGWRGSVRIGRKATWPTWTPPAAMIRREPSLRRYAKGMPGGINNPLGARALYLYRGKRDTLYRIHGTNEPWSIGRNVSSGCIRLNNSDIVHLYKRAKVGARVIVR